MRQICCQEFQPSKGNTPYFPFPGKKNMCCIGNWCTQLSEIITDFTALRLWFWKSPNDSEGLISNLIGMSRCREEIMPCVAEAKEIHQMWVMKNTPFLKRIPTGIFNISFHDDHSNTALQYSSWLNNYCNSSSVSALSAFLHHGVMHSGQNLQSLVTRQHLVIKISSVLQSTSKERN